MPGNAQEIAVKEFGDDIVAVGIEAVARLGDHCRGLDSVNQRDDVADAVVAVQ